MLFPFLNGEDLNSRPDCSPSRWVINFDDRSEAAAGQFALPFHRVVAAVRSEREQLRGRNSSGDDRAKNWWKFGRRTPGLNKAIASLSEVLVIALVSKTVMPMRVPTGQVFSHALGVFASDSYSVQAVLSSNLHQLWAITYGSTLETRVRYTPSDVFETFPLPPASDRLDSAGRSLDAERRRIMLRRDLGLTKLYNLVNDPAIDGDEDVDRLREIHVEIDCAATAAYGWDDIPLSHGFHSFRQMQRWSIDPSTRVEILDRLLIENHSRSMNDQGNRRLETQDRPPTEEGTLFE